jgi:dihydroorotate dehydrogenase
MYKQAVVAQRSPIQIKGIGAISDGYTLRQHELAGADSFAVGSHAMQLGGKVFPEIIDDYLTHFG